MPIAVLLLSIFLPVGESFAADAIALASETTPRTFQIEHSFVHLLASTTLQRSDEIYIKLPPGYDKSENAQQRHPVVYLNDGSYTFQVASGETRVPFDHGTFEQFVLVGLSYAQGEDGAISRERDLTLMLSVPELFQNYILTSTSLWYNNRAMLEHETTYARHHTDLKANVYFAIGQMEHPAACERLKSECSDFDMVAGQAAMVKQLRSHNCKNLQLHTKVVTGAHHTTTLPSGLLWALQELFLTQREPRK